MAQTPQVFRLDLIRAAHERAHCEEIPVTDDASMVERLGAAVRVVPGSPRNIKITTPEDLDLAAALLGAPAASSGNRRYPVAAGD
jgi:2-C-methyl-D-erythritol 4-phosphate cytidylyltransferase